MLGLAVAGYSCQEDEPPIVEQPTFENLESEWIRLAAWDASGAFSMINPIDESIKKPTLTPFTAGSANYLSSTGQYITSVERTNGIVRFFDTGIVNHEDHGHEYETRWLNATAEAPLPTHYSATSGNIVIFNDGDGSITWAREATMETPGFQPILMGDLGNGVHHGAATWLSGNKFAVTYLVPELPGTLPQTIKILDVNKSILAENPEVTVGAIHGDASNGTYAIFGGSTGVLVARSNNELFRIDNTGGLEPTSGNWMGTIKAHDNSDIFYGWARNKGIFSIDPAGKSIRNIYSGNDVRAYFFSADGSKLIIQTTSNQVMVYNSDTGSEIVEAAIPVATVDDQSARKSMDEYAAYRLMNENPPVLSSSENYLYVLSPSRTEIDILGLNDLKSVKKITLTTPVNTIMRVGFQTK